MLGGRLLSAGDSDFLTTTDRGPLRTHRDVYLSDECWTDDDHQLKSSRPDEWDTGDLQEPAERPSSDDDQTHDFLKKEGEASREFSRAECEGNLSIDDGDADCVQPEFGSAKRRRVGEHHSAHWAHEWDHGDIQPEREPLSTAVSTGMTPDPTYLTNNPSACSMPLGSRSSCLAPSQQGLCEAPSSAVQQSNVQTLPRQWEGIPSGLSSGFGQMIQPDYLPLRRSFPLRVLSQPRRRELVPFTVSPRPVCGSQSYLAHLSDVPKEARLERSLQISGPRIRPCRTSLPKPSFARLIGRGFPRHSHMFQPFPGTLAGTSAGLHQSFGMPTKRPGSSSGGRLGAPCRQGDGYDEGIAGSYRFESPYQPLNDNTLKQASVDSPSTPSIPSSPPQQHLRDSYGALGSFAPLSGTPESLFIKQQQEGGDQLSPDAPASSSGRHAGGWRREAKLWGYGQEDNLEGEPTWGPPWLGGYRCDRAGSYSESGLVHENRMDQEEPSREEASEFPAQSSKHLIEEGMAFMTGETAEARDWLKCESPQQVGVAMMDAKGSPMDRTSQPQQQEQHHLQASNGTAEAPIKDADAAAPYSSASYSFQSRFLGLMDSKSFPTTHCNAPPAEHHAPLQSSFRPYPEPQYEWLSDHQSQQNPFYNSGFPQQPSPDEQANPVLHESLLNHVTTDSNAPTHFRPSLYAPQSQNQFPNLSDPSQTAMDLTIEPPGTIPYSADLNEFVPPGLDSLNNEYRKLLKNIPRKSREAFSPSDEAAFRTCHPHYSRNCFILMHNGYDIRLGEIGRASLKKEISKRLKGDAQLRERCVSIVCRLKNANVLQLLQMAEIAGCLSLGLKISSSYWKDYSRKQRPGAGVRAERHSSLSSGGRLTKSRHKKRTAKDSSAERKAVTEAGGSLSFLPSESTTTETNGMFDYSKDQYEHYGCPRMGGYVDSEHPTSNPFNENILISPNFPAGTDGRRNSTSATILSLTGTGPVATPSTTTSAGAPLVDVSKTGAVGTSQTSQLPNGLSDSLNSLLCRYHESRYPSQPSALLSSPYSPPSLPSRDPPSGGFLDEASAGCWASRHEEIGSRLGGFREEAFDSLAFLRRNDGGNQSIVGGSDAPFQPYSQPSQ